MNVTVDISIEGQAWAALPELETVAARAVRAAAADADREAEVSCLFTDDDAMRALNARWRGIDTPTNVLSFPSAAGAPPGAARALGDIVLAYETVAREAARDGKAFDHHLSHLLVHGTLHLLGHDHEADAEAETMEALESRIMAGLGLPDPHVDPGDRIAIARPEGERAP